VTEAWVELDRSGTELPRLFEAVSTAFSVFSPPALDDDARIRAYLDFFLASPRWENPGRAGQHHADHTYDRRLDALGGVSVPCQVIGFELDMLTPAALSREVANAIPGCRYVEVPRCGHGGPFERPDEVTAALVEFFAQV